MGNGIALTDEEIARIERTYPETQWVSLTNEQHAADDVRLLLAEVKRLRADAISRRGAP